jgi:DNA (cytosine-5)-methyltransferase 1
VHLAIDLFAGIGCASLGFKNVGFKIMGAVEIDPTRCANYETNIGLKPIQEDISSIGGQELLSLCCLKKREDFCLIGCPPCQSFSKLSHIGGVNPFRDPRSHYVLKFAELVEETRPYVVVFENVPWMLTGPGRQFFSRYCRKLEGFGYRTVVGILDAADFGVPQHRRRVVAISRLRSSGKSIEMPEPYFSPKLPDTVRKAIGDLKHLKSGERDPSDPLHRAKKHEEKTLLIFRNIAKDGGSRKDLPKKLWLKCHSTLNRGAENVYGRMWWDKPSGTITGRCTTPSCGRFIHPEQDRGITLREAARLQTIPDSWKLSGVSDNVERMIGDAVPVNLVKRIALKVSELMVN